jgi:phenylacetic acid degradation operon negative regulatory protein
MAGMDAPRAPGRAGPARPFNDDVDQVLTALGVASPRLPRRQVGGAPQNLAVILMADFTLRTREWVPSAAIVELLAQFDVSAANARTTISRLARRGILEAGKLGRNTFYRLSAPSTADLVESGRHLAGHPEEAEAWDGSWSLVAFSLPNDHGADRRALRSQLRWQGFAPLYDGLWVRPAPLGADGVADLVEIAPSRITAFRSDHLTFDLPMGRTPLDAWDLAGIDARYRAFIERWQAHLARPDFKRLSGVQALVTRTAVIEEYRLLPLLDPPLPLAVMPRDWPRLPAHETLTAVYDGLARPATRHVLDVMTTATGQAPPPGIGAHTVSQMAAGLDMAPPGAQD